MTPSPLRVLPAAHVEYRDRGWSARAPNLRRLEIDRSLFLGRRSAQRTAQNVAALSTLGLGLLGAFNGLRHTCTKQPFPSAGLCNF